MYVDMFCVLLCSDLMLRRPELRFLTPGTTAMHSFDAKTAKAEGKRLTELLSCQLKKSLSSCTDLISRRAKLRCLTPGTSAMNSFAAKTAKAEFFVELLEELSCNALMPRRPKRKENV